MPAVPLRATSGAGERLSIRAGAMFDWDHRGAAGVDGGDDLGVVDPLQVLHKLTTDLWAGCSLLTPVFHQLR
jgi:hypothetical protein